MFSWRAYIGRPSRKNNHVNELEKNVFIFDDLNQDNFIHKCPLVYHREKVESYLQTIF